MTPWVKRAAAASICAFTVLAASHVSVHTAPRMQAAPQATAQNPPQPPPQTPPPGQQPPPQTPAQNPPGQVQNPPGQAQQPPPVFRGGVRLVRVDVTVTGRGDKPVADLAAEEFEVTEDGVPQRVEQLQFVRLTGQRPEGDEASLDIRSQAQAEAEASRDDVRVFGIFLDDYHVDKTPQITIPIRRGLADFIDRLWPSDLVAIMDPLTTLSALEFTRSKQKLQHVINSFEGRQGEIFPIKSVMEEAQLQRGDLRRVRAEVTLLALQALATKLAGLKEGRKSIIFVSQGPPTFVGSRDGGSLQDIMRDILRVANRGNVQINVVDPVGLTMEMRLGDKGTLYQLAGETGGRTIINTNDLGGGMIKTLDDATAYYVLGYTPTRTEDDGKYHKISVKVKRSGAKVTARQGYWAPSTKDLETAAAASSKVLEPRVAVALGSLAQQQPGKRAADVWMGVALTDDGQRQLTVTWEPVEPAPPTPAALVDFEYAVGGKPAGAGRRILPAKSGATEGARAVFVLEPGLAAVTIVAKAADGSTVDRWTQQLDVPDVPLSGLVMATPRIYRARNLQEFRAIRDAADPTPGASRQYSRTDRVLVDIQCRPPKPGLPVDFSAHVQTREGQELAALPTPALENGRARFELPVGSLGQGTYILRLQATVGAEEAQQLVAFRVVR
jgi:VWFA-related protein